MKRGRKASWCAAVCQPLEGRVLLSGFQSITGSVTPFNSQLANMVIYDDRNGNQQRDNDEPITFTDYDGHYHLFTDGPLSRIRPQVPEGYLFDHGVPWTINPTRYDLIVRKIREVSGVVFQDLNENLFIDSDEQVFGDMTVFEDVNGNHQLDDSEASTLSDSGGRYTLMTGVDLSRIWVVLENGWSLDRNYFSYPSFPDLRNLAIGPAPIITGTAYEDLNRNTTRDADEPALAGVTVYLDLGDARFHDGQATAISDENGQYSLTAGDGFSFGVRPATAGWSSSNFFSGLSPNLRPNRSYTMDAPMYRSKMVHGVVFDDQDRDGVRDPGETGVGGIKVFSPAPAPEPQIPPFGIGKVIIAGHAGQPVGTSDSEGNFTIFDVPISSPDIGVDTAYVLTNDVGAPDDFVELGVLKIPSHGYGVAAVRGVVFDDLNNNGVRDSGEPSMPGAYVFASESSQSAYRSGAVNVIIDDRTHFPRSVSRTADANGYFELNGLFEGQFTLGADDFGGDDHFDTQSIHFSLGPLEIKTIDLPVHPYSVIWGEVWWPQTPPLPGLSPVQEVRVYLDRNDNGRRDRSESFQLLHNGWQYQFDHMPDGPYTLRLQSDILRPISPPHGMITHTFAQRNQLVHAEFPSLRSRLNIYLDGNGNGRRDRFDSIPQNVAVQISVNYHGQTEHATSQNYLLHDGRLILHGPLGKVTATIRWGEFSASFMIEDGQLRLANGSLIGLQSRKNRKHTSPWISNLRRI